MERVCVLVRAIVLSEWAVLAFLCFLHDSLEGMPFFTNCPDSQLLARREEPIGERGMLFRLSAGLVFLIRSVGVAEILEGTAFDATDAEQLLTFAEVMDWSGRPDLVHRRFQLWFRRNRRCTMPVPSGFEAEVGPTDGAAPLGLADAADAVDAVDAVAAGDASMLPTDDGVSPARGAVTDAAKSVAGSQCRSATGPLAWVQSRATRRRGLLTSGVTEENLPGPCDFRPPLESPAYQRGDRYRRRSPIRFDADSSRAATVGPVFLGAPPRGGRVH